MNAKEHYVSRVSGYLGLLNKNGLTSPTTLYMQRELFKLARAYKVIGKVRYRLNP